MCGCQRCTTPLAHVFYRIQNFVSSVWPQTTGTSISGSGSNILWLLCQAFWLLSRAAISLPKTLHHKTCNFCKEQTPFLSPLHSAFLCLFLCFSKCWKPQNVLLGLMSCFHFLSLYYRTISSTSAQTLPGLTKTELTVWSSQIGYERP